MNRSKLPMPIRSFETVSRLEPRRDVLLNATLNPSIISSKPSVYPIPSRLPPLKRDNS